MRKFGSFWRLHPEWVQGIGCPFPRPGKDPFHVTILFSAVLYRFWGHFGGIVAPSGLAWGLNHPCNSQENKC
jgi:hypothetical protein